MSHLKLWIFQMFRNSSGLWFKGTMSRAFFLPQLTHQVIDWQFSNFQVYADDAVAHTKTRYVPTEGNVERNFLSKIYVTKTYVTVHTEEKEEQNFFCDTDLPLRILTAYLYYRPHSTAHVVVAQLECFWHRCAGGDTIGNHRHPDSFSFRV